VGIHISESYAVIAIQTALLVGTVLEAMPLQEEHKKALANL